MEAFVKLAKAATRMHLQINEGKTKYVPVTRKDCYVGPKNLEIASYKFDIVHSFTYLSSEVNCKNNINVEIRKCILSANRCISVNTKKDQDIDV